MKKKYRDSLVREAHILAFHGDIPYKNIAQYLCLTKNELHYVLYSLKPKKKTISINEFASWFHENYGEALLEEFTITESFLNFFTLEKYK